MVWGISPFAQVNSGQDSTLTGDAGVNLVIRQDHGINLDGVNVVAVITKHARHFDFADFAQLLNGEAAGPASVLVPKAIAGSEVGELLADDAGEGRSDHGTRQWSLSHTSRPEINVVGRVVVLFVTFDSLIVHDAVELVEGTDTFEATKFSPLVVGRNSVFSSSLDIQWRQVQTPFLARLLEQMVGHFLRNGVVQSLSHLRLKRCRFYRDY